jgi:hypothetical protein
MSNKELILDVSIAGLLFEIVNPELNEGDTSIGEKNSVNWESVQLKDDPLKRDLTVLFDLLLIQKITNFILLSFKEGQKSWSTKK